jgi:hypothetical protein
MPRFTRFAAACITLLASAPVARAQVATHFSVAAGAAFPTGSFGDFHDTGYNVLAAVDLQPALLPLAFRLDGMFNEFDFSGASSGSTRVIGLAGNAVLKGGALGIGPYLIGGIGVYGTKPTGGSSNSDVGFNIGGGFRFGLTGFSVFAEARYHRVAEDVSFIPVTFGITF